MIALDTNVIVRLVTQDDEGQFRRARMLLAANEVFIPDTVFLETAWVLRFAYSLEDESIVRALRGVMGLPNVHVADVARLAQAIEWFEAGLDFADAMHLAASQVHEALASFDRTFVKRAADLGRCHVLEPPDHP